MNTDTLLIVAVAIGAVLIFVLMRRRGPDKSRPEMVRTLLSEVRINQALVETFELRDKPRAFETASWHLNKKQFTFLEKPVQAVLTEAFTITEGFNQQIKAAKKDKSYNYKANIQTDKLKEPLAKSRDGLEEWLLVHVGRIDPPTRYPSITDYLFGGGR